MGQKHVVAGLLVTVAVCVGCAINPVSKRPEAVLTTVEGEKRIGREETEKVREQMGFVEDVAAAEYVRSIGNRLAQHSPRQDIAYHFHIVEMQEPNAFALPGGHVFVSRGLLAITNSEAEIANVIGHEIGHIAARHSVQRATRSAPFALVTGVGKFAANLVSRRLGNLVGGVGGLAGSLVLSPYSRRQEREADLIGQKMAAAAGWDPAQMTAFMETLQRDEVFHTGHVREATFLDSHPTTPERVKATAKNAAKLTAAPAAPIAAGRAGFLAELEGLRVGPNPAEGVFVEGRFLHPVMNFGLTFPSNWQTQNTAQAVAARPRTGDALAILQLATEADDMRAAVVDFEKEAGVRFDDEPAATRINGLPALRGIGKRRDATMDVTWISYGDLIYRITGAAPPAKFPKMRDALAGIAASFGPLSSADRSEVKDARLRVIEARGGEKLDALIDRSGSAWKAEMALLANGMVASGDLAPGDLLKLPIPEQYVPPLDPDAPAE